MPGPGADPKIGPADRLWPSFLAVTDHAIPLASVAAAGPEPSGWVLDAARCGGQG